MNSRRPAARGTRAARKDLDRIDLQLLRLLVQDSRRSQRSLAKEVGLSAPAVAERIAQLEAAGVITGYTAQIDLEALGYGLTVYVNVQRELGPEHREQSRQLTDIEEVEKVVMTTGSHDLLLKINVRDRDHLNDVLFNKLIEGNLRILHSDTRVSLAAFERDDYRVRVLDQLLAELGAED
ncbi:Lrp/AsnC family transcriptional regulator [Brevibacterium album]|uniref:Lrp/AsnC family transcriptional regulator n=1 Tax=Brevibacterium album TaxID=417948 RepID=UPI0004130A4E|nr:Lrp/AsnC family transcriptional regulator [Brevibacterium album]